VLNFLAFFFAIDLSHYGRYVSPISSRPPCLTFGVHYIKTGDLSPGFR
jgi:hypothetical protein